MSWSPYGVICSLSLWWALLLPGEVIGQFESDTVADSLSSSQLWHLDAWEPGVSYGISWLDARNHFMKDIPGNPLIVAILDTGIDTAHDALNNRLWRNPGEEGVKAHNGRDDDGNAFIDDAIGWNFLGNSKDWEQNVSKTTYERERVYHHGRRGREWRRAKEAMVANSPERLMAVGLRFYVNLLPAYDSLLYQHYSRHYNYYDLERLVVDSAERELLSAKGMMMGLYHYIPKHVYSDGMQWHVDSVFNHYDQLCPTLPDSIIDYREKVVDFTRGPGGRMNYGNGNVAAGNTKHGTHVAGIIAAMTGRDVSLMAVRVVPTEGDEYDEDVANGIRYAVDNGAKIINMSFGKAFSPDRKLVNRAIRYANRKGVLLVHAAGNDHVDIDTAYNYPNPWRGRKKYRNYITVGASTVPMSTPQSVIAPFSNIGKRTVDVFAPGERIFSTLPNQRHGALSGTSMAAPVVSGLAAMLWSYYPHIRVDELRSLIEDSVTIPAEVLPSKTGGVVNVCKAFELAAERYGPIAVDR